MTHGRKRNARRAECSRPNGNTSRDQRSIGTALITANLQRPTVSLSEAPLYNVPVLLGSTPGPESKETPPGSKGSEDAHPVDDQDHIPTTSEDEEDEGEWDESYFCDSDEGYILTAKKQAPSVTYDFISPVFQSHDFEFQLDRPVMEQFAIMREALNWNLITFERESIHLADAAIMQFNHKFGHSAARLQGWQALCTTAEVEFVPDDVDVCQALLRDLNVDIFEFVEASLRGGPLRSQDPSLLLDGIGITDFHGLGRRELAGDLLRELSVLATEEVDLQVSEPVKDPWAVPDTGLTWDTSHVSVAWVIPDAGAVPKHGATSPGHSRTLPPTQDPIRAYFARYPGFSFDATAGLVVQYEALRESLKWRPHIADRERARFQTALVHQFGNIYGHDTNNLEGWQKLCRAANIDPVPRTLKECRRIIEGSHINLVDFVESHFTGTPVKRFATEAELSQYTLANGKIFSRNRVPEGSLLSNLLRHILHPRTQTRRSRNKTDARV